MAYLKFEKKKKWIIGLAIVFSIFLYLSGVFSGLYANKIIEKKTIEDIKNIKAETESGIAGLKAETVENVEYMKKYVQFLENSLSGIQFEQIFMDSLNDTEKCSYSTITMDNQLNDLGFYWERLPFRIEAYEKSHNLTSDYLELKKQYMKLSIRAWTISREKFKNCKTTIYPILYFYNKDCKSCVEQGVELDKVQEVQWTDKRRIIVFTIDFDSDESMIKNIKRFYNITSTPAMVIGDSVLQGNLTNSSTLVKIISKK